MNNSQASKKSKKCHIPSHQQTFRHDFYRQNFSLKA